MFGWFAVVSVALIVLAEILFVTVRFVRLPSCVMLLCAPADNTPLSVPASTVPLTDKLPNWPTPVILGWLAVVSVALIVLAEILCVTVRFVKLPNCVMLFCVPVDNAPLKVPPWIVPLTDRLLSCPTAVMLG